MSRPTWQDLNAYVDGELSADAAAAVAHAVALDRELAVRVAALAQLKAAAGEALAVDPSEVPQLQALNSAASSWRRTQRRWLAYAAASLLVALIGIAGLWISLSRDGAQGWIDAGAARHVDWLESEPDPAPIDERSVALVASASAIERLPDLGFARLRLAHIAVDTSDRHPGLYVGYVGFNGCRLGLWIAPVAEGLSASLTEHRQGLLTVFTWRVGSRGYAVLAANMDEHRLSAIARHLEQVTRASAQTRIAGLADSAVDAPCTA